jgi:hypothetical protein
MAMGAIVALGASSVAQAQDVFHDQASGVLVKGGTACVGPLAPTDAFGVQVDGFTNGPLDLTWQVWSVSSQSAPALVFEAVGPSVLATVPPSGNLLYYACVARGPKVGQDFDLLLKSAASGPPANPAVDQRRSFGTTVKGMITCSEDLEPTGVDGVQIFGFTNGFVPLTWRVESVDGAGVETLEFSTKGTFVDETIPPTPGLVYHACVKGGPGAGEDFDLALNSTTIQ